MNSDLDISSLKCWIVGEGLAGTENQCIGVAESLGVKPVIKRIELREPWKSFSPALGFEQWWGFKPMMYPPWPDLVIAAGRKAVAPARFIRKAARAYEGNDCFTVFLQDPKCKTNDFDMVCAPKHDELDGANVLTTVASPNRISEALLKAAKAEFSYLGTPPAPRIAVLIGGNSKSHQITKALCEKMVRDLKALDGSLMVTTSRRTPEALRAYVTKQLSAPDNHIWDGSGHNPYMGYLAHADVIIVTSDSASMLSDACSTGKPVYRYDLDGGSEKFTRLYRNLEAHGALKPFPSEIKQGKLEVWAYEPLNDVAKIANAIGTALKKRNNKKVKTS